jgi:Domain of unknown function (DUF4249)
MHREILKKKLCVSPFYLCEINQLPIISIFMKPYLLLLIGLVLAMFLVNCIDPYADSKLLTTTRKLIVNAKISNQPEPFTVRLTRSVAFLEKDATVPVIGAKLYILDNLNNRYDLIDIGKGNYQTVTNQTAIEGRSYQLFIQSGGKNYESAVETLRPVPAIDKLTYQYKQQTSASGAKKGMFEVILETKDNKTTGDYYRWTTTNYRYLSICYSRNCYPDECPVPVMYRTKCCSPCWEINRDYGRILLASDNLINGNAIKQMVAIVPYTSYRPYYLEVAQYSLSKGAYDYWTKINTQINNTGSIFDAPPANIRGNIVCKDDPTEQVLGYFETTSVSYKNIFVLRDNLGIPEEPVIEKLPLANVSIQPGCRECAESAARTAKRPADWRDDYSLRSYDPLKEN